MLDFFNTVFADIPTPVLVYRDREGCEMVYQNRNAKLLLNPLVTSSNWDEAQVGTPFHEIFKLSQEDLADITALLSANTRFQKHVVTVELYNGDRVPVSLCGNKATVDGEAFVILYIYTVTDTLNDSSSAALATAINLAYMAKTTDEAINNVLAFAGSHSGVSRTYIFESVSDTLTANTYEWCAAGVASAIDQLQNLPKDAYSYDAIIEAGMAVTDDIRQLSEEDRAVLEPQGIKSLAVIPMFSGNRPLGYIGFDDCNNYRKWTQEETHLLRDLSELIASLLMRRDTERRLNYSFNILRTVTDNSDNLVYVSDIVNNDLLFANKPLSETFKLPVGQESTPKCWEVLQKGMEGPCPFCPLQHMLDEDGNIIQENYSWQFQNTVTGNWYLIRDSIIKWIDGRLVHIETATDISIQKEYESVLERSALTDSMTGLFNREWGRRVLERIVEEDKAQQAACLVFLDLDGLKRVNDTYGHQAGDMLIKRTVKILEDNIRKSDLLCRWGGDEFIMILRAEKAQAEIAMDKILAKIAAQNAKREFAFDLGFSYGLVEINSETATSIEAIISEADRKMYVDKLRRHTKQNNK